MCEIGILPWSLKFFLTRRNIRKVNKNIQILSIMFLSAIRQFSQKSNILVVGGGQIGKSVALGLNRHGYENITVADPNNTNQRVLEEAGIKECVRMA